MMVFEGFSVIVAGLQALFSVTHSVTVPVWSCFRANGIICS